MRLSTQNQYKRTTLGGMGDITDILSQATSTFTTLANTALNYQQQRAGTELALTQAKAAVAPAPVPSAEISPAPVTATTGMLSTLPLPVLLIGGLFAWKILKR